MKVFVVYDWIPYEGCSQPKGAFRSREAAEAFILKQGPVGFGGRWHINELDLDDPAD